MKSNFNQKNQQAIKDVYVTSVYAIESLIQEKKIQAVLSIEHPGAIDGKGKAPILKDVEQRILCFWDTENKKIPQGPTWEEIEAGFEFLDSHKGKRVAVHCKAGKCRSAGLLLGWLAKEHGVDNAMRYIHAQSEKAAPNLLVVEICDAIAGLNGTLVRAVLADPLFTQRRKTIRDRLNDKRSSGYALERR